VVGIRTGQTSTSELPCSPRDLRSAHQRG
jgi:hypothetical protein